ncbi:DNA-binding transcriptional regulator, CsgD family [Bosea sp. CRIB-10]|uniref:helix-turn-helix transcriptional regulator n=1 Tax=Bosea sp. CRIB-10 TaxID=378404 RepID=UPI0008EB4644|nr:helix-turn-helix transcriptional regulator [Bosea sp. CRIB-10]SFC38305.1 DNA-binding transcriptional regulator, CsgD family [Bosea sp. CRIB-10]
MSIAQTYANSSASRPAYRMPPKQERPAPAADAICVFTLDAELRVERMNAAALALTRTGAISALRFTTRDRELNSRLQRWSRHAAPEAELRLAYRDAGRSFALAISLAQDCNDPHEPARFVVVMQEQAGAIDRKLADVARDHGLTDAETRVAERILTGENTIQAARRLGVAPTTVRTHLQRILAKTDTHRQSEFACLVARYGH